MRNTFYRDDDCLAHYGVKGMKWGVRKSQSTGPQRKSFKQKASEIVAKGYKAAANRAVRNAIEQDREARQNVARAKELAGAKSLGDFASMTVGNKRNARVHRVNAEMYDELAKYSNRKRTKNKYKAAAENSRTFEKYYDRVRQKKGKDKAIEMITGKESYSLPWKRANGKTISYGRHVAEEIVNNLVWSGAKTAAKNYAKKVITDELKRRSGS
jgi:hypothetical protein